MSLKPLEKCWPAGTSVRSQIQSCLQLSLGFLVAVWKCRWEHQSILNDIRENPEFWSLSFGWPCVHTPNGDTLVTYPKSISPALDPTLYAIPDPTLSLDSYATQSSPSSSSPERFLKWTSLHTPGAMILE